MSTRSDRTNGSPPVSRILVTPCETNTEAIWKNYTLRMIMRQRYSASIKNLDDLISGEKVRFLGESDALFGHAVLAPQVASLGQGDPEVGMLSPEGVRENLRDP